MKTSFLYFIVHAKFAHNIAIAFKIVAFMQKFHRNYSEFYFREFFEDVSKVATQYVPPRQPNEPFNSKVGELGDDKKNY